MERKSKHIDANMNSGSLQRTGNRSLRLVLMICIFCSAIFLTSCFEEDQRVLPYPGEVITVYDNIEYFQSYFDFESGEVVSSHSADLWQLGFECGAEGWHILTNSGANWFIWNSRQTDINAELSYPENKLWEFDNQSTYPDSTAVGDWLSFQGKNRIYTGHIYLLGRYSSGSYTDIKRIQFIETDSSEYNFLYKEGADVDTISIQKTDTTNFVYYSFDAKSQINLEPNKLKFDLLFGPYYDMATQFNLTIPYLVRGVFLNTENTTTILDSINFYDAIDFEKLAGYQFSSRRNVIGFDWKEANVNTSANYASYTVKENYTYIIQTSESNYYKLRFLSFTLEGSSGFPRFEYKELKPIY